MKGNKRVLEWTVGAATSAAAWASARHETGLAWMKERGMVRADGKAYGKGGASALLGLALVASVIFIVLANLWPTMSTANQTIQTQTATDAGTTTSKTIFSLLLWLIPLGIGIALVLKLVANKG